MILDHLKNRALYEGLFPRIATALAHLAATDLDALAPGRYPILGDEIVLLIQEVPLVPESEGTWESHYLHIDIQSPIRGSERMGRAAADALELVQQIDNQRPRRTEHALLHAGVRRQLGLEGLAFLAQNILAGTKSAQGRLFHLGVHETLG